MAFLVVERFGEDELNLIESASSWTRNTQLERFRLKVDRRQERVDRYGA